MKKWVFISISVLILSFCSVSLAEFQDSEVNYTIPSVLDRDTFYVFAIKVVDNTDSDAGDWIYQVDLTMPSTDYEVDYENLEAPEPLHEDTTSRWDVMYEYSDATITWLAIGLTTSSAGDIRGGEELLFRFRQFPFDPSWLLAGFLQFFHGFLYTNHL